MRLLAFIAALWALALPSGAATTAQKAATAPNLYACGVANGGILPYLCADFQHGVYVLNGKRYSSPQAMGFTTTGSCVVSGGTGLACTQTSYISMPSQNPASGYMLVGDASDSSAQAATDNAIIYDGAHFTGSTQTTTFRSGRVGGGTACGTQSGASGKDASYQSSTTAGTCAVFGQTAGTVTAQTAPAASATLYVGGVPSASNSVVAPFYVRSVRIYKGTFTNAQVQTASTQ